MLLKPSANGSNSFHRPQTAWKKELHSLEGFIYKKLNTNNVQQIVIENFSLISFSAPSQSGVTMGTGTRSGFGGCGVGTRSGFACGESGTERGSETAWGFLIPDIRSSGYPGSAAERRHKFCLLAVGD